LRSLGWLKTLEVWLSHMQLLCCLKPKGNVPCLLEHSHFLPLLHPLHFPFILTLAAFKEKQKSVMESKPPCSHGRLRAIQSHSSILEETQHKGLKLLKLKLYLGVQLTILPGSLGEEALTFK
jgi:hypothetical protein